MPSKIKTESQAVSIRVCLQSCIKPFHVTLLYIVADLSGVGTFTLVACVAGRRKGGKSKWAREGEGTAILPRPIFSRFTRSSFLFPSPSDACHASYHVGYHIFSPQTKVSDQQVQQHDKQYWNGLNRYWWFRHVRLTGCVISSTSWLRFTAIKPLMRWFLLNLKPIKVVSSKLKVVSPQFKVVSSRPKVNSPKVFSYDLESNKWLTWTKQALLKPFLVLPTTLSFNTTDYLSLCESKNTSDHT